MAAQTGQKVFGAGRFFGVNNVANSTPVPGLVTQDISLDFKRDPKRLYGQKQMAIDVAAGMLVVTGKTNLGGLQARLLNDLVIGGAMTTGQIIYAEDETLTVLAAATASSLVNGAALQSDLGIYGATDGVPLVKASTVAVLVAGQYAMSTLGVITLSSLDSRTSLKATYTYSTVGGQLVTMTNQNMGKTGNFAATLTMVYGADKTVLSIGNCMMTDLTYATKLDDFMRPPSGFDVAVQTDGNLGYMSFAELS